MKKQIFRTMAVLFSAVLLAGNAFAYNLNASRWEQQRNWNRGGWNTPRIESCDRRDRNERWEHRGWDRNDRFRDSGRFDHRWR